MSSYQEQDSSLAREQALHTYVLGPWSEDHSNRPDSVIQQRPYNRGNRDEQRLKTYRTPPNEIPTGLPAEILGEIIESKLASSLEKTEPEHEGVDPREIASEMVRSIKNRVTSKTDDTPLIDKIKEIFHDGENLNSVDAHYEFTGGLKLHAALMAALRDGEYIRRSNALISKTMTREAIAGKSITELVTPIAGVIWVAPDTDSFEELIREQELDETTAKLIEEAVSELNNGAMREIKRARAIGGILQWAPFSSALVKTYNGGKLTKLTTPRIPRQVPGLLGRSRYTLPMAFTNDDGSGNVRWEIGDLIDRDRIEVESKKVRDGIYLERTVGELCTMQARISGVPIEHLGKVFEPIPQQIDAAAAHHL